MKDVPQLVRLAAKSWNEYKSVLTDENWKKLNSLLTNQDGFIDLLRQAHCILCETTTDEVIGMAFLVPQGNPTDIYLDNWSYIRLLSVDPSYNGNGIGRELTERCIHYARETKEEIVALHTSEMMKPAIALYEKMGFTVLREIEPRLGKRYWLYTLEV